MSSWAMVAVVAIIVWGCVQFYKMRHGILSDSEGNETRVIQSDPEKDREIEELRERVKVLEKIATDPARRTAEEIEKLRDER
ncbi:MAG: hypothetical protein HKO05_07465 [Erythrobacter sp.]|jgi:hypothetical protein|nr:hypothetical protein [Erythrobacter sp.]